MAKSQLPLRALATEEQIVVRLSGAAAAGINHGAVPALPCCLPLPEDLVDAPLKR